MNAVKTVWTWAKRRPANPAPNGVQLMAWVILVATPLGVLFNAWSTYQDDLYAKCEQRVDTRNDVRGMFTGIFDYVDPNDEKPTILDLRAQLDLTYPPITISECMAGSV